MRVLFLTLVFSLAVTSLTAQQKLRKPVADLAQAIAANNKYESQYTGFAGTPSTQYQQFQELRAIATKAELVMLLRHTNAVVRIYSFRALYQLDPKLAEKSGFPLLNDTATFTTLQGCIAGTGTVKTYVSHILRNTD